LRQRNADSKMPQTSPRRPLQRSRCLFFRSDYRLSCIRCDALLYGWSSARNSNPNTWLCLSSKESRLPRFHWNVKEVVSNCHVASPKGPIVPSLANTPPKVLNREETSYLNFHSHSALPSSSLLLQNALIQIRFFELLFEQDGECNSQARELKSSVMIV
jgi:hypothetical protein